MKSLAWNLLAPKNLEFAKVSLTYLDVAKKVYVFGLVVN